MRSPAARPARSAGLPGCIVPISAGTVGYQNSNPRPGSNAPGSVSGRGLPVILSGAARVVPSGDRTSSAMAPPSINWSRMASTTASRVPVARVPTATISSPDARPADAAID